MNSFFTFFMEIRSLVIPVINTAFRMGPRITVAARGRAEQFRAMPRRVGGFTEDVDAPSGRWSPLSIPQTAAGLPPRWRSDAKMARIIRSEDNARQWRCLPYVPP